MDPTNILHLSLIAFLLVLGQLSTSLYQVVMQHSSQTSHIDMCLFAMIRCVLATPLMFCVAFALEGPPIFPTRDELPYFAILSTFMSVVFWLYVEAIALSSANMVAVLGQLSPLYTLFIAILIKAEPPPSLADPLSLTPLFSLPIAFVGAVVLLLSPWIEVYFFQSDDSISIGTLSKDSNSYFFGIIIMIFQTMFFAAYLVYYRRWLFRMGPAPIDELKLELPEERKEDVMERIPKEPIVEITREAMTPSLIPIGVCRRWKDYPVTAVSYFTLASAFLLLIPLSIRFWIDPTSAQSTSWKSLIVPLIFAINMTGFLYVGNSIGLKYLPSSVVSAFSPLTVLFTILLSKAMLSQSLSNVQIVGIILIIVGVGCMILTGLWKEYRNHYERTGEGHSQSQSGD